MSGGSFDYAYYKLDELSHLTSDKEIADLLKDLADLMHDEEWWKSGDYSKTQYKNTLKKFKAKWFGKDARNERLKKYVMEELENLKGNIDTMIGEYR